MDETKSKPKESPMKQKEDDMEDTGGRNAEASESEMSVVLDEEPKPKRKRGTSTGSQSKKPKKQPAASKSKDTTTLDSDQAEIKRLQGWLIKCGIRKMWHRELAPYDTPKTKISHLKGMLKDAGMSGRYSVEKAKKIKEERELKADLQMVQEGAKRWGADGAADEADEESEEEKPRRRLARGLKNFDFLGDDGEETD